MRDGPRKAVVVAWSPLQRCDDLAHALGGEAMPHCGQRRPGVHHTLARYVMNATRNVWYYAWKRPGAVVVVNPPIFAGLLGWLYARLGRASFALDSHPAGFGAKGNTLGRWSLPLHAWLAARSDAVLVTSDEWVRVVQGWGGRALIVHEPPGWELSPAPPLADRARVLFVCTFAQDEPVRQVIEAARLCPGMDFEITGDLARAPQWLSCWTPENVRLVGYLDPDGYRDAITRANVVLALSTEPTSVMRCAYEAVYAGRPLVVWDWPIAHEVFPSAIACGPAAEDLAGALKEAVSSYEDLVVGAVAARAAQIDRWEHQLSELLGALGLHPDLAADQR